MAIKRKDEIMKLNEEDVICTSIMRVAISNDMKCPACGSSVSYSLVEDIERNSDYYNAECVNSTCGFGVNSVKPIDQIELNQWWKLTLISHAI